MTKTHKCRGATTFTSDENGFSVTHECDHCGKVTELTGLQITKFCSGTWGGIDDDGMVKHTLHVVPDAPEMDDDLAAWFAEVQREAENPPVKRALHIVPDESV